MSRSRTRRRGGSTRRRLHRRWAHRIAWLLGATLSCLGAMTGAFGTVAWLTVLCATSFSHALLGIVTMGLVPVVGGGALLWAGLSVLEDESARQRVRTLPEARFVEAASGGATLSMVALRLGVSDHGEVEQRLDELVARDVLALEANEEGELLYRALC